MPAANPVRLIIWLPESRVGWPFRLQPIQRLDSFFLPSPATHDDMARTKQTERALSHLNVALHSTGPLVAGLQNHLLGLGTFEEFLPSLPGWPVSKI